MARNTGFTVITYAWVVELVDTLDLGSSAARRRGSTPLPGTMLRYRNPIASHGLAIQNQDHNLYPDL